MLVSDATASAQATISMMAMGDNPGLGFNYQGTDRKDGVVIIKFQLPNIVQQDIENVWLRNYEPNETTAVAADGTKYTVSNISLGGSSSSEGVTVNVPQGQKVDGVLTISGVPADINALGKVTINLCGQYPMDANVHNFSVILENVGIRDLDKKAAPAQTTAATPAAKSEPADDGKAHPGRSGGLFVTGNAVGVPADGWQITAEACGPIKLHDSTMSMPGIVDKMFNKVKRWDANSETLYLDGTEVININIVNDRIAGVTIYGPVAKVKVSDKLFGVGDSADELKTMPGVKSVTYNDDCEYNGIRFTGHDGEITNIIIGQE